MAKIDGRSLDHKALEHLRIVAVKRVLEDGEPPSAVMAALGLCRTTIYRWLRAYKAQGPSALQQSVSPGPTPKLTPPQALLVREWIIGKDPRQHGFDFGLWTRKLVQELVRRNFGVELCLASIGKLLASLDITPQKPLRRAYERDPLAVARWQAETYPELKRRAKRRGARIFFLDEAGFQSDPPLGRTYGLKGKTPVVVCSGQRQSINAISAVTATGAFWAATYTGKLNAESFRGFLQDFMRCQRGRVFLVVDGHPSHKANLIKEYVTSLGGRLELHFLPPYAPDLNPDEFVWQYMKSNGVSKRPLKKNESLRKRVEAELVALRKDRRKVRSFFKAQSVAYTAD